MSINRIYAGEVAMALALATSLDRKPDQPPASSRSLGPSPKALRGLLRLLRKLR